MDRKVRITCRIDLFHNVSRNIYVLLHLWNINNTVLQYCTETLKYSIDTITKYLSNQQN